MDKFYERLEGSNRLLDAWQEARAFVALSPPDEEEAERERYYRRVMYVYRELDNLEYGLAKYRIGYMSAENAYRCLRTFRARCLSEEFRNLAMECEPGYNRETMKVVREAYVWALTHGPRETVADPSAVGTPPGAGPDVLDRQVVPVLADGGRRGPHRRPPVHVRGERDPVHVGNCSDVAGSDAGGDRADR